MTTIALARQGDWLVMACDGRMSGGGTILSESYTKIRRIGDVLIGFAGTLEECERLMEWYASGGQGRKPHVKNCSLLMACKDGKAYFSDNGSPEMASEIPAAIGSGAAHALTALDLGCSAQNAVRAAMLRDTGTGGKVQTLRMRIK